MHASVVIADLCRQSGGKNGCLQVICVGYEEIFDEFKLADSDLELKTR